MSLISLFVPFALAALPVSPPMTPAEEVIARDCLDRGASEAECACGIAEARKIMSPSEMNLLADLVPAMSSATDTAQALEMVPAALERNNIAPDQFAPILAKVLQFGSLVEERCTEEPSADAAG